MASCALPDGTVDKVRGPHGLSLAVLRHKGWAVLSKGGVPVYVGLCVCVWQSDSSVLYRKLCAASDVLAGDDILRWNLANTSIPSQLKVRRTGPALSTIA